MDAEKYLKNESGDKYEFIVGDATDGSQIVGSLRVMKHWNIEKVERMNTCPHCGGEI